jgi:hypothetical protein
MSTGKEIALARLMALITMALVIADRAVRWECEMANL